MSKFLFAAALLGVLLSCPSQAAKLYKWTDAAGQTHYSQTPPPAGAKLDVRESSFANDAAHGKITPYCLALGRFAGRAFEAARGGADITDVVSVSQQLEREHLADVSQGQLVEIANYAFMTSRSKESAIQTAKRIEDRCMRGDFGNLDARQANRRDGKAGEEDAKAGAGPRWSGTGWFAAPNVVVTNLHVVKDSRKIDVVLESGRTVSARVWRTDDARDLALLSVTGADDIPALPIAEGESRLGAKVFTIGFPHTGVMGVKPKLTDGVISARSGLADDPSMYQISVPVQSGNSGGPLLDQQGNVVGIVTAKLNAGAMYRATEDITQNVNFAVKSSFARKLAGAGGEPSGGASLEDVAERVQRSVVRVLAN